MRCAAFKCTFMLNLQNVVVSYVHLDIPRRLCAQTLEQHMSTDPDTAGWSLPSSVCWVVCLGFPQCFRYSHYATLHLHQAPINHSSHPVTFALFKKILQTLPFRRYNYLPFHISEANILALRAVYLTVFVYRLTFCCIFIFVK